MASPLPNSPSANGPALSIEDQLRELKELVGQGFHKMEQRLDTTNQRLGTIDQHIDTTNQRLEKVEQCLDMVKFHMITAIEPHMITTNQHINTTN